MENSSGGDSGSLSEESSPPGSSMKRKMVKSDKLYTYIGNIIMADTVQWRMLLTKSGTRGRPDAVAKLQEFLTCNETASELCKDKKVSTQTITNWLNECIQKARTEQARRREDAEHGRSSAHEPIPEYVNLWCDLMDIFDAETKEAIKSTRYNTPPIHLQGKVFQVKSDTAYLPCCSSGAGAAIEDREEAFNRVNRSRALFEDTGAELEPSGSSGPAKKKAYLYPRTNRPELEKTASLADTMREMMEMEKCQMMAKHSSEREQVLTVQLNTYLSALKDPSISPAVRARMDILLEGVMGQLEQIQGIQSQVLSSHRPIGGESNGPGVATQGPPPSTTGGNPNMMP
jgi:hypothetical protein